MTTTTAPDATRTAAALELNGLTIDAVISKWHEALQVHVDQFHLAAGRVLQGDIVLLENQKTISHLAKEAQLLRAAHSELRSELELVSELMFDLHAALEQLEKDIAALEKERGPEAGGENADAERIEAYELAGKLEREIEDLGTKFQDLVAKINRSSRLGLSSTTGNELALATTNGGQQSSHASASLVLRILNQHFTALEWLDRSAHDLQADVKSISSALAAAGLGPVPAATSAATPNRASRW